ncbi:MAG: ribose-phosphate pyrophosphokinase [Deltaproteobacteria bacterium]|nr:ribose-phosphate pyrophosphokinase [Deltaproteobacteria bacterium]
MSEHGRLTVLSGRSNLPLAQSISSYAGVSLGTCNIQLFCDGELNVEITDNVRGNDVFVIQSTSYPVNDHLMELAIMIDALKRSSARRITAVLPYFGYARQDRKVKPRVPITAKLVADILGAAGASRVLTVDLHSGQIMGFFDVPVDNLYSRPILLRYLKEQFGESEKVCVISPDSGGVPRARAFAARLDTTLAIIDKRRLAPNEVAEMNVVGEVRDRVCLIVDDMIDTGQTLVKTADAVLNKGAKKVVAVATHGVLSGGAWERLMESSIDKVVITDTIDHPNIKKFEQKFVRLSIANLIGEAIRRIHEEGSISSLFEET